jgi:EmrB/QacA subfamily drug resistance transporter
MRTPVLVSSCLTSFATPFAASAVNVAIPSIGRDLQMSTVATAWIATAYLLTTATFLVPFGRLADIHGRKRVYLAGMGVFTVASIFVATAPSGNLLIGWRVVQALGISAAAGTSVAILTSVFPPERRGAALGINSAAVYSGLAAGPVVSGILTHYIGWRSVFLVTVPLGLAPVILMVTLLRNTEWRFAEGESFDLRGALLYCFAVPVLLFGLTEVRSTWGAPLLLGGGALLLLFIRQQLRSPPPVLDLSMFATNLTFRYSILATLLNYAAASATGFLVSLYLQTVRGMSPRDAGLVLMSQPIVQAIFSPLAGRLSDRVPPRTLASLGMGLCCGALALLAFLGAQTPLPYLLAFLVVMGLGFALFSSPNTNAVMGSVDRRSYSLAAATLATMRSLGQASSLGVITVILSMFVGAVAVAAAPPLLMLRSIRTAFAVFSVLCFVGIFASLARPAARRGDVASH